MPPGAPGSHLEPRVLPWNTKTCPSLYSLWLEAGAVPLPVFPLWLTSLVVGQVPGHWDGLAILTIHTGTSLVGPIRCGPEGQGLLCCASSAPPPNPSETLICMTHLHKERGAQCTPPPPHTHTEEVP